MMYSGLSSNGMRLATCMDPNMKASCSTWVAVSIACGLPPCVLLTLTTAAVDMITGQAAGVGRACDVVSS